MSRPLPSNSEFFSIFFQGVTLKVTVTPRWPTNFGVGKIRILWQGKNKSTSALYQVGIKRDYQVGVLWANNDSSLHENVSRLVQLESLERRHERAPNLKSSYAQTIKEDFDKGYIVKVDKSVCFKVDNPHEWYLPHHPVLYRHRSGNVRRVLNGAAKIHGVSQNDFLLTGPDLWQTLAHVRMRFRQHSFAVSEDIEGAFLQVGVFPQDQPPVRFLRRQGLAIHFAVYQ